MPEIIKKKTSEALDSVNGHMVQSWLLMGLALVSWNNVLFIPPEISLLMFGAGFDRLIEGLAKARDGK
jgi:hypothetical protein